MKPRNCNECKHTKNCNSAYGSLGCRYNIKPVLTMILVLALCMMVIAFDAKAEEVTPVEEVVVINAEDIGVKTIEKEVVEDEPVVVEAENQTVDEIRVQKEKVTYEPKKEVQEQEEAEPVEEEDLSEPPEGMFEGYISGEYLPVNYYECELHDGCYMCKDHNYEISYSKSKYNGELKYYCEKICVICGHGKNKEITESEYNDYFEND